MKSKGTGSTQGGKRKGWCWENYLEEQKAAAAPAHLFNQFQAPPTCRSGFRQGMRLEGIDPLHPSMFCVLSVAEVIGHRLRLHIDGYPECYDFWVNADSPDIRPVGWCARNEHRLHPPKGHSDSSFSWQSYLESTKSQAAPERLFEHQSMPPAPPCRLAVGMRLEAVDRKNPSLVCVASVSALLQHRFLVHFDQWDDTYDYWCDSDSPYIHPVGWCQEQGRPLTAPQGHPNPESFQWDDYLRETNSSAAPRSAFNVRPPHGFQSNQRLEAVDVRNPMLVRVATITETDQYRVKIHYDGWPERFDVWCDSDLADLHPVGWCQVTEHPLEVPPGPAPLVPVSQGVCPTPGCRGVGHIKGAKYSGHHSAFGCPYSDINMRKPPVTPDRLGAERIVTFVPLTFVEKSEESHGDQQPRVPLRRDGDQPAYGTTSLLFPVAKRPRLCDRPAPSSTYLQVKEEEEEEEEEDEEDEDEASRVSPASGLRLQQALHQSVFLSAMTPQPGRDLPLCWEQHCKLLPGVEALRASTVTGWSTQQVSEFILSLPGCEQQAQQFLEEQIDGRAFLLLSQSDIVRIMSIKLGPALKIYNSILMFKHAEEKSQLQARDKVT